MNLNFSTYLGVVSQNSKDVEALNKGYIIEMHVVDHCNLNCYGCNHFSPLAEPYYISVDYFYDQLQMLHEKLPNVIRFSLLGGEPLMHPQLKELTKIVREFFPEASINILSNGILANSLTADDLLFYQQQKVGICVSGYNGLDLSKFKERINHTNYNCSNLNEFNSRLYFRQTLVDIKGQQPDYSQRLNCKNYSLPCFTLQDYKIYICPFAAHIRLFNQKSYEQIPITKQDYLDIRDDITITDLTKFCLSNKNICKYCKDGTNIIWHKSLQNKTEFVLSEKELYFYNYDQYNSIYNNPDVYNNFQKTGYIDLIDFDYAKESQRYYNIRYGKQGKIDIIIPYYNITDEQCKILKNNLLKQTIIHDCMIYFISDNSLCEDIVLSNFMELHETSQLNIAFLKTPYRGGPGLARQIGINNSYNDYFFFLDIDDLLIIHDGLEQLYNFIKKEELELTCGKTTIYDMKKNSMKIKVDFHGLLIKRDFVNKYKICFPDDIFINEDACYLDTLTLYNIKYQECPYDKPIYMYIINNDNSIFIHIQNKDLLKGLIRLYFLHENLQLFISNTKVFSRFIDNFDRELLAAKLSFTENEENFLLLLKEKILDSSFNSTKKIDYISIEKKCAILQPFFKNIYFWKEII